MFNSILVVCVGNICRSPLGERLLRAAHPHLKIDSAGLAAVVGAPADAAASQASAEISVSLEGHVAQQLTGALGSQYDLILVMEPGHRREIQSRFPELSGKTMLFDQWTGGRGIPDPYRKSEQQHRASRDLIRSAAEAWASRLARSASSSRPGSSS